jgi:hypothetical protein
MKTDRFTKVMLVIIALPLALNCANGIRTPFTGNINRSCCAAEVFAEGQGL